MGADDTPIKGSREALDALLPLVYDELRELARRQLGSFRPGQTLNTTALVHEAYLKLVDRTRPPFNDRRHFLAVAAIAMRQIVVDFARSRAAQKRGGAAVHTLLNEMNGAALPVETQAAELLALDAALERLARVDERLTRVVELRFFAGLSIEEAADVLGVSTATVKRDMRAARAFLHREMSQAHE